MTFTSPIPTRTRRVVAGLLAAVALSAIATAPARAANYVDNIYYDGGLPGWTYNNVVAVDNAVDIETYNGFSEFVTVGPEGVRDYYFDGVNWTFAPMYGTSDYSRITTNGNGVGKFFALGTDGRIDHLDNNTASTTTIFPAGTLTNPVAIETYHGFNNDFLAESASGVVEYYLSGTWQSAPVVAATDYIEIASNYGVLGAFFALGTDGRVDELLQDQTFGTWSTTNILPPGTLTNPKYIESYDSNNEFVTVSAEGVRENFFSGGWTFEQMSTATNYFAIADNNQAGADYWALATPVEAPEPASLVLLGAGGLLALARRRRI